MAASQPTSQVLAPGTFIGQVRDRAELKDYWIKKVSAAPHHSTGRHLHDTAHFIFVLDGLYITSAAGSDGICPVGSLIFAPPGTEHDDRIQDGGGHVLAVSLKPDANARIEDMIGFGDRAMCFTRGVVPWLGARLNQELAAIDAASPLVLEGLMLEILGRISRHRQSAAKAPPPWLGRIIDVLRARFAETVTIAELSQIAGISPAHLVSAFRQHYGQSVGDYVRGLRIDNARQALVNTRAPLGEIALAAGFYDQSHFSRAFKHLTGLTPSQYRTAGRATRA